MKNLLGFKKGSCIEIDKIKMLIKIAELKNVVNFMNERMAQKRICLLFTAFIAERKIFIN